MHQIFVGHLFGVPLDLLALLVFRHCCACDMDLVRPAKFLVLLVLHHTVLLCYVHPLKLIIVVHPDHRLVVRRREGIREAVHYPTSHQVKPGGLAQLN